jgi:nitrogen fixation NifU-like protein
VSSDLAELYQEVIIDHARRPRNFGELADATRTVEGLNPLCGDQLKLHVKIADGHIADIAFEGVGCAISQASASLMTMALKGMKEQEALVLFDRVHTMLTEGLTEEPSGRTPSTELGTIAALSGVWQFPSRVKCAALAWHTLREALAADGPRAGTE